MINKIKIFADDREFGALHEEFEELGVEYEVKRLEVGDFVFDIKDIDYKYRFITGDKLIFERKTIDDFCSSIMDERLEEQACRMYNGDGVIDSFIIVEGHIEDRTSSINEHCILGMVGSLLMRYGINVVFLDNKRQMAFLIKNIIEKCIKKYTYNGEDDFELVGIAENDAMQDNVVGVDVRQHRALYHIENNIVADNFIQDNERREQ
jgi:ERCC4-type nuclease